MDREKYVLGVDGGGSGTRCIISTFSGSIISRGNGGPSNPLTVGAKRAASNIINAVRDASDYRSITKFKISYLGIAGTDKPEGMEALRSNLRGIEFGSLHIVSDAAIALAGATGSRPGIIVISGTGSIAYGNNFGRIARAGGWGWRLGDEGSGYYIGKKALIAALRDFDGRGPPTIMRAKIEETLGIEDPSELVNIVYSEDMEIKEIAAIAPLVCEAAEEGDNVALKILKKSGEELGIAANAVIHRLELKGCFPVAVSPWIFEKGGALKQILEKKIRKKSPNARIIKPRFSPEIGAILLALKEEGSEIDEALFRRIEDSKKVGG
jgi:N-acetylglucosamine kinase-like BadF-type ATPase